MLEGSLCTECLSMQFYDPPTQACKTCHDSCRSCSGPGQYSCVTCAFPLHLDRLNNQCVPCCTSDATPEDQSCCHCDKDTGRCLWKTRFAPLLCCLFFLNWRQKIKRFIIICCNNFFSSPTSSPRSQLLVPSVAWKWAIYLPYKIHCFYLPLTHPRHTLTVPLKWKFIVVFRGFKSWAGAQKNKMLCCDIFLSPERSEIFRHVLVVSMPTKFRLCTVQSRKS